ncbi:MAG: L,D-transpeptidase [Bauldia sp.]|nr:L,D-transpeptidase [Bauldia sp.]
MRVASIEPVALTENTTEAPGIPVTARIDLSDQTMTIYVGEKLEYVFKVSTGRKGYGTPTGRWNAAWLSPRHRSRKYNNAPMPWSVFFHGGYAVHGTTDIRRLGRPASHGCVRLHPDNAKTFFSLVQKSGKENTLISIVR